MQRRSGVIRFVTGVCRLAQFDTKDRLKEQRDVKARVNNPGRGGDLYKIPSRTLIHSIHSR